MSLIVARKYQNHFIIVGDTKLTYEFADKNKPSDGIAKIIVLNSQLCIAFAGEVYYAEVAFKKIKENTPNEEVIEILKHSTLESEMKTEYIVCIGNPSFNLIIIKEGKIEIEETTWIGSNKGFNLFQKYYHQPQTLEKLTLDLATFKKIKLPDEFDEEGRKIYSLMFNSMNGVIDDYSCLEVGGFITPVIYENDKFNYNCYVITYRKPINFQTEFPNGKGGVVNFGNASDGSYSVNFGSSFTPNIGIHLSQGDIAIHYSRIDNGLLKPIIYLEYDEIDFTDKFINFGISLCLTHRSELVNFAEKGLKEIHNHNYKKAADYLIRGISTFRLKYKFEGEVFNRDILVKKISAFNDNLKEKIDNELNNLKLAYYYLGQANEAIGQYDLSHKYYSQSISIDGQFIHAHIAKGELYLKFGNHKDAIQSASKCINIKSDENTYFNRARMYFSAGELDLAEKDIKVALNFKPEEIQFLNALNDIKKLKKENGS